MVTMNALPTQTKKKKTLSEHHFMTNKMWSHSEKQFQNNIRGQKKPPQSTFSHMQQSFLLWRRALKEFQTPSLPVFFATHFLNSLCQCCLPEAVFIRVFWTILWESGWDIFHSCLFSYVSQQQEIVHFTYLCATGNTLWFRWGSCQNTTSWRHYTRCIHCM